MKCFYLNGVKVINYYMIDCYLFCFIIDINLKIDFNICMVLVLGIN